MEKKLYEGCIINTKQEDGNVSLTFSDIEGNQLAEIYLSPSEALLLSGIITGYANAILNGFKE